MIKRRTLIALLVVFSIVSLSASVGAGPQEELVYHPVEVDEQGKIVPWYSSDVGDAYDHTIKLVWGFWKNMKTCPNGLKYYMQHRIWKKKSHHSGGLGGDQFSEALSSWNLLHQYLGEHAVRDNMIYIADYYIDHSM